jgi:DNA-binding response OmpR family regulator
VKAILRRAQSRPETEATPILRHGGLVLDPEKQKVTLNGQRIELTHHEFTLLHALMAAPGRVFSRDELLAFLYPNRESIVIDRVVDVHIGKVRQKLEKDPTNPAFILTVRGSGYRFAEDEGGQPRKGGQP